MGILESKPHKDKYEVNLYYSKNSKSHYHNIVDKDPNALARIFMDWYLEGIPVEEAYAKFIKRLKRKDWLGFD